LNGWNDWKGAFQCEVCRRIPGRKGVLKRVGEKDTIMDEVASIKGEDKRAVEAFLSAVETISKLNKDPEFYNLTINAVRE
jgi:hypothetical protein